VYETLKCLNIGGFRVKQEKRKNLKFVGGLRFNGGLLNLFFFSKQECRL
jgi:hypothetical protein